MRHVRNQMIRFAIVPLLCFTLGLESARAGNDPGPLPRCEEFVLEGNANTVSFTLFAGQFNARLTGRISMTIGAQVGPLPPPGYVGVRVHDVELRTSSWTPQTQIVPEPYLILLNQVEPSEGLWNTVTGDITLGLSLYSIDGVFPAIGLLSMSGTLDNTGLQISGSSPMIPDSSVAMTIRAVPFDCSREVFYSTEFGFTRQNGPVSDGDLLSIDECVIRTNFDLTQDLAFKPIVPDLGLDAVTNSAYGPVYFSLEEDQFSATLGPISNGDLLSSDGRIVRTNQQLVQPFVPMPPTPPVGLDAVHAGLTPFLDSGGTLFFSVEEDFFSQSLGVQIGHGDLLSEPGILFRRNQDLLAKFLPTPCTGPNCPDYGLDAVYIHPNGEIWFSVEESFMSPSHGFISDGAVLSDRGFVVLDNLDLLFGDCQPLEDLANFGLDALDRRVCPACPVSCRGDLNGDGVINAADLAQLLGAWGNVCILPCPEDFDGNGIVDIGDLAILLGSWGPC
ncbi:MAG: hypothetical protein VYC34_00915 [Planctomycetota bacterium]|nr:hypothetical protein [Planctomycetota bacterium]